MITIQNGAFQTEDGVPIANGAIVFQLSGPATVTTGGGVVTTTPRIFQLDTGGNILPPTGATSAQIFSNAELTPNLGTYYYVTVYDSNNARVFTILWQFTQAAGATVNLSTMAPFTP